MTKKAHSPNDSPHGWWIASYIERYVPDGVKLTDDDRCLAWENTILLRAPDRESAYLKALENGKGGEDKVSGRKGPGLWKFEGLTSLLPIYDEIEDGAELMWTEHRNKKVKSITARVKKKHELECFQDD
nr:putative integron gene cassette protein [uncultured bacterium]